jgi:arsenate reductase-like glutaredoxin family protein
MDYPGSRRSNGRPPHNAAMIILYGIPNCDTVTKARTWLTDRGVDYRFHDFRKQGVPADRLDAWLACCGAERLLNRQGTTWRSWTRRPRPRQPTRPKPRC